MELLIINLHSGFSNRMFPLLSILHLMEYIEIKHLCVVWANNVCRSCMQKDSSNIQLTLNNYFKDYPANIEIFRNLDDIVSLYQLNRNKVYPIDFQYLNNINQKDLKPITYIYNMVHICNFIKSDENKLFCPYPRTIDTNFQNSETISQLKTVFNKNFTLNQQIIDEAQNFLKENQDDMIGIHLRVTDGGHHTNFQKHALNILGKINDISSHNTIVYLACDDSKLTKNITHKYKNIITYDNQNKFLNNDFGTFYSLVDLYLLSRCTKIYITPGTSFGLLAYIYGREKQIDFLN